MKKYLRIILSIIGIIIVIILQDTLQARIFKHSPIISYKVTLVDNDSWVDKGILMDTYYCTKENDIVTVSWHFKTTKYTCPINNLIVDNEVEDIPNVIMTIKEGTLTNTGATIIITDTSGSDNTYGEYYRIERQVNDSWQELDVIVEGNYGFNAIGYKVGEDNTLETHNWGWLYGKLEDGVYRLVKKVNNNYFSVIFTITNLEDNNEDTEVTNKQSVINDNSTSTPSNDDTPVIKDNKTLVIKTIIDKNNPNTYCAQAIDVFYIDDNYIYYYTCLISQNIIVTYTNGREESIKTALINGHIKITDLDKYNIHYLKEKKETTIK